jgi:hypothetical protein
MIPENTIPLLETDEGEALIRGIGPGVDQAQKAQLVTTMQFLAEFGLQPAHSSGTTICPYCGSELKWTSGRRSVFFRCAKPDCFEVHSRGGVSKLEHKIPVQKRDDMFNLGSVPDEW